jgi:hypothetical protein
VLADHSNFSLSVLRVLARQGQKGPADLPSCRLAFPLPDCLCSCSPSRETELWSFCFTVFFLWGGAGVVLGFELRALNLLGRYSTTWTIPQPFLLQVFLEIGSQMYAQAGLDSSPPIYASHVAGIAGICTTMPSFLLVEVGSQTTILSMSTSWAAGITGISHHASL